MQTNDNFIWKLNKKTGKLTIQCDGEMPVFTAYNIPWKNYRKHIVSITI